jgi:cystathionine beta-synthase
MCSIDLLWYTHLTQDYWIKTNDKESFIMSRRLIREEGFLCGGSSGTAMVGALQAAKILKKGQRCVVLLPDSVRNYMTKFLSDDWMKGMGYMDEHSLKAEKVKISQWGGARIRDLNLPQAVTIDCSTTCKEAIAIMQAKGFDQLPVVTDRKLNHMAGMVTLGGILAKIGSNRAELDGAVEMSMYHFQQNRKYTEINADTPLDSLSKFFEKNSAGIMG